MIKVRTYLSPLKLLQKCLIVEKELGRIRIKKNDPRTCDIDIIDYDQRILRKTDNLGLRLPHPEMHKRNFVLLPLYEISKKWIHPVKKKQIVNLINLLEISDLRTIKLI